MAISRRAFLATGAGALAVLAVGGAAGGAIGVMRDAAPEPTTAPSAPAALSRAVQREQQLLRSYAAAQSAHPELADRLAPIVADHTAHLDVLGREWARVTKATAVPDASSTPSAAGGTSEPAGSPTAAPPVPGAAADALAALRAEEQSAAAEAGADCLASTPDDESARQLAVLLGSISACETVHVGWLG